MIRTFKFYVGNSYKWYAWDPVIYIHALHEKDICVLVTLLAFAFGEFWRVCVCMVCLQIRCLKGQRSLPNRTSFDRIHFVNHYGGDNESYQSSDEDGVKLPLNVPPRPGGGRITLHPQLGDTDSDADEDGESLRLTVPSSNSHKSTTVWPPSDTNAPDRNLQGSCTWEFIVASRSRTAICFCTARGSEIFFTNQESGFGSTSALCILFLPKWARCLNRKLPLHFGKKFRGLLCFLKPQYWKSLSLRGLFYAAHRSPREEPTCVV